MSDVFLNTELIFGLIGGLGLFLFGMKVMSEGLQKVAGARMRRTLGTLTDNRVLGATMGLVVTLIVQSSSATSVMVVNFVNSGMMTLVQSIGVMLGANLGTALTAQLIAFKITHYALPAIGFGAALRLFSKNKRWGYVGEVILGFGLLFLGLATMKQAFDPVKASEDFRQVLMVVGDNHLLAVLVGAAMTVIVQSSSATIGMTLALASSGLLTFEAGFALILGEGIGTTITTNLAAFRANVAARRTAIAHGLFNVCGVAYMLVMLPYMVDIVSAMTPGEADFVIQSPEMAERLAGEVGDKPFVARHIVNAHSLFAIINTLLFLPLVVVLANVSSLLARSRSEPTGFHLKYLDDRVLNTPQIALGQARSETQRMAGIVRDMVSGSLRYLADHDERRVASLERKEELIDLLQKEITDFLVKLSQKSITQETSQEVVSLMHIVNEFEHIGDYCQTLWRLEVDKSDQKIRFSEIAQGEIAEIADLLQSSVKLAVKSMDQCDISLIENSVVTRVEVVGRAETLRNNHIRRLNTGECTVNSGLIFIEMLNNFEKIASHADTIVQENRRD